jgi:hypothetical protein
MIKNILIVILFILLVVAGFFIVRERRVETETEGAERESEGLENVIEEEEEETPQVENPEETDARTLLVGTWRSLDDPQSTLVFHSNGEITDSYGGGVLNETGSYQLFEEGAHLRLDTPIRPEGMVLRQTFGDEEYYYEIIELSAESLELGYLTRGGLTLRYERLLR